MRRRELVVEFRTPQHPSLGTNNWGGASPLLARDIPKESLEQRYLKLNSVRTRDEICPIPDDDDDDGHFNYVNAAEKHEYHTAPSRNRNRGLLWKLLFPRKGKTREVGSNARKGSSWLPRWDPQNRWPQGWVRLERERIYASEKIGKSDMDQKAS
ncbi:hypothetical protein FNV43_RR23263 [Rhamnella rubrinervis]|uniref:Uncharacterized protein n=1 Tax=Rhamnella rubrinervis TaxID=2594499 RepID=A0A8K0DWT1_9ROSA|nr:hypothetical protein FNV43_RR23263 [Rhamnella rubrinervis]